MAEVLAVCISREKGTVKTPTDQIEVRVDHGIVGDAHAGSWHRQISLLADESVDTMRGQGWELTPGVFAENILTRGITLKTLPVGTLLQVGPAVLRVTQIGKACHKGCAIREKTGRCVMPTEGIFAVVVHPGVIQPGDEIAVLEEQA